MEFLSKIILQDKLAQRVELLKSEGRKVSLCHGTFDLLHPGHLKYFQEARGISDILVVTITADKYVNKGPGRPLFDEMTRAESIASLEYVDYVSINFDPTAINLLKSVKPNFYVKGPDYKDHSHDLTGMIGEEVAAVESVGGEVYYTNGVKYSSTELIEKYFQK